MSCLTAASNFNDRYHLSGSFAPNTIRQIIFLCYSRVFFKRLPTLVYLLHRRIFDKPSLLALVITLLILELSNTPGIHQTLVLHFGFCFHFSYLFYNIYLQFLLLQRIVILLHAHNFFYIESYSHHDESFCYNEGNVIL